MAMKIEGTFISETVTSIQIKVNEVYIKGAFDWEIRKRISPPRNPSSGWILIENSKSGFFGFPFLSFDWKIRKRIC